MNNNTKHLVPWSDAWKTFVADATEKHPEQRTLEEREALALARTHHEPGDPTKHIGIRCEHHGAGEHPPAAAWWRAEDGRIERFATMAEAQRIAEALNANPLAILRYEARAFVLGLDKEAQLSDSALSSAMRLWARENIGFAETVLKARAIAELETERVDKYIAPIFAEFEFFDDEGQRIKNRDDIYLSSDEVKVNEFWARCDAAHQANGHKGEPGTWPNRQAEHTRTLAENALVKSFCEFLGMARQPVGKKFQQLLKLLLTVCIAMKAESKQS